MYAIETVDLGDVVFHEDDVSTVKRAFTGAIWAWFHNHENDSIKSFWIISIRVRDLRFIFEALVGPE